jgi:hypothetical protein
MRSPSDSSGRTTINSELAAGIVGGLVGGVSGSVATLVGSAYLGGRQRKRELRVRIFETLIPEALAEWSSDRVSPNNEGTEALRRVERAAVIVGPREQLFAERALAAAAERRHYFESQSWASFGKLVGTGDVTRLRELDAAIRKQLEAFLSYLAGKLD